MSEKKIGLVLSGGGMRGAAHVGAIRALIEHDIKPTYISGTSAGAIAGAMYAVGLTPDEMKAYFEKENPFQFNYFSLLNVARGLIDTDKFQKRVTELIGEVRFEDLPMRLFVAATDIGAARLKIFESGPLVPAVVASASFPLVFSPTVIGKKAFIDGGVLNNFPVEPLHGICDVIIGVNISPLQMVDPQELDDMASLASRVMQLAADLPARDKLGLCDLSISPEELRQFGLFSLDKTTEIHDIGYRHMKSRIAEIKKLLGEQD